MADPHRHTKCKSCREPIFGLRWQVTDEDGQYGAICERCRAWLEETDYERCVSCGALRHETYVTRHPVNGRVVCSDDAPFCCREEMQLPAEAVCDDCGSYAQIYDHGSQCLPCLYLGVIKDQAKYLLGGEPVRRVSDAEIINLHHECGAGEEVTAREVVLFEISRLDEDQWRADAAREDAATPYDRESEVWG